MTIIRYICIALVLFLPGWCAAQTEQGNSGNAEPEQRIAAGPAVNANDTLRSIDERESTVEKDRHWIEWSYTGIGVRKLNAIPPSSYADYARFVDNGSVYVIVHPAYYVFFHQEKPQFKRDLNNFSDHIVNLFLREKYQDPVMLVMQEQQKNEKNFVEYISTEGKLIILVLPRDYKRHQSYGQWSGLDEYSRYINDITNGSESVVYIESETATSGKLLSEDLILLLSFLEQTNAKSVLIGGGYVGRCQKEFYNYVSNFSVSGKFFIVPEISTFSPADMSEQRAVNFFNNRTASQQSTNDFIISRTSEKTNLQHLSSRFASPLAALSPSAFNKGSIRVDTKKEEKPADKEDKN